MLCKHTNKSKGVSTIKESINSFDAEIYSLTPDVKNGTGNGTNSLDIITSSSQTGSEDLIGDAWGDGDGLLD